MQNLQYQLKDTLSRPKLIARLIQYLRHPRKIPQWNLRIPQTVRVHIPKLIETKSQPTKQRLDNRKNAPRSLNPPNPRVHNDSKPRQTRQHRNRTPTTPQRPTHPRRRRQNPLLNDNRGYREVDPSARFHAPRRDNRRDRDAYLRDADDARSP